MHQLFQREMDYEIYHTARDKVHSCKNPVDFDLDIIQYSQEKLSLESYIRIMFFS